MCLVEVMYAFLKINTFRENGIEAKITLNKKKLTMNHYELSILSVSAYMPFVIADCSRFFGALVNVP